MSTVVGEHTNYVSGKLNLLDAGEAAHDENIKNINSVFQFNQYYLTNVSIFIQIWKAFHQPSPIKNSTVSLTFPGIASGVFYKIVNFQPIALSGLELAKIITPASEEAVIVGATLYDSVEISDDDVRPTAAKVVYTDHQDAMGYFGQPDDMQVAAHTVTFDVKNCDYPNSLVASMFDFVGHITLTSAKGSSVSAGKQNDSDVASLTLECPYRIALIYVPDDDIGYTFLQSGHQMTGIACGVVYDNKLAAAYANQSLEKLAAK